MDLFLFTPTFGVVAAIAICPRKIFPNPSTCFMAQRTLLLILLCFMLVHCGTPQKNDRLFEKARAMGVNKNHKLEEASGLVASSRNPGMLWSHNDSGNPADIFLIDSTAATRKVFKLPGLENRDWEDIARGPGPEENVSYLYIGDIGDNLFQYDLKYIYRFREPSLEDQKTITGVDTLTVALEGGAIDSETLMIDPSTRNLYIVSKRDNKVRVYEIVYPFTKGIQNGNKICTLTVSGITGGDISPDGNEVLLKSYERVFYWKKTGNESIAELLKTPPTELAYRREPQGEGIAWAIDGSGFYTLSENAKGERGTLYYYKRRRNQN